MGKILELVDYLSSAELQQQYRSATDPVELRRWPIYEVVKDKYLVLTDDFKLAVFLQGKGVDIINFNHLRIYGWS